MTYFQCFLISVDPAHAHFICGEVTIDNIGVPLANPVQDIPDGHFCHPKGQELPGTLQITAKTVQTR